MSTMIEFQNVSRIYKSGDHELRALDNLSLKIDKGEFVVILGPSGAGKSTLLNLLGGLDSATSGKIIVDGRNIVEYDDDELTKYRAHSVGFIFQFYNLIPNLTAKENVELMKDITDVNIDGDKILESVGLTGHGDQFPAQLSGGEQQRVSIARALAKEPAMLLCDEPTGALDSRATDELLRLFTQINRNGQTILMVTHSVNAASHANRVLFIKDGEVFHQIYRGNNTNEQLYQLISDTLTMLATGGERK